MTHARRLLARAPWRTVSSRRIYANPWIRVREDIAAMPDGRHTLYGVVECRPAVGVLAFPARDTIVLVGQYRYVARTFLWEIPTGSMNDGESEIAAAQRELAEEIGYTAGRMEQLIDYAPSPGLTDATMRIYLASDLQPATRDAHGPEETHMTVVHLPLEVAIRRTRTGEIVNAAAVIGLLLVDARLGPDGR